MSSLLVSLVVARPALAPLLDPTLYSNPPPVLPPSALVGRPNLLGLAPR